MGATFVKVCGITRLSDARAAVRAGAQAVGFVFAPSPRRVSPSAAARIASRLHPAVRRFGVFVDATADRVLAVVEAARLDSVQLHGAVPQSLIDELRRRRPGLFIAKVLRATPAGRGGALSAVSSFDADAIFIDPKDPSRAEQPSRPIPFSWLEGVPRERLVVAGGLNPSNVGRLVRTIRPWGVDTSSGVESAPGKKDAAKVSAFLRAVRAAEAPPAGSRRLDGVELGK